MQEVEGNVITVELLQEVEPEAEEQEQMETQETEE
jgi:hypothetical protein